MEPKLSSSIVLDSSQFPQRNYPHHSESRFSNQNHNHSSDHIGIDEFAEFAKETFRRYEESNQRIDAFSLYLGNKSYARYGLATEWTLKALKLGATDLTFRSHHPNIVIPLNQAVFGNKNVARLCLSMQGWKKIETLKVTECPGLKSLTLRDLAIKTPESFFDLISCCPSLEDLSLSNISCEVYKHEEPALVPTLFLPRLRSLVVLGPYLKIKTLFLDDLSSKFPNLKHLTLGSRDLEKVSSSSVETLNIHKEYMYMGRVSSNCNSVPSIEFDVPSIRRFTFESDGKCVTPDVSFRSISAGYQYWEESHVSITHKDFGLSTTWFRQLSKFLTNLRGSKIHLCLHMHSKQLFDYYVGELDGLTACEVEDLTLDIKDLPSLSCHAILDGLFRICRPKMITQYLRPPKNNNNAMRGYLWNMRGDDRGSSNTRNNDLIICRLLEEAMQVKSVLLPTQFMYGLRDLEEIDAQQLIDEVWTPQPLGSILAHDVDSTSQQSKRRFRLQLKWKPFVDVVA